MAEKKYYVVWAGHQTGLFDSWKECRKAVEGYQGALYKSFKTHEQARQAMRNHYSDYIGKNKKTESTLSPAQLRAIGLPRLPSISVDAACSSRTDEMEYQGVDTLTKALIFHRGPFMGASNNLGEFLAIVHALALFHEKSPDLPIYTDSRTAMAWLREKKVKTTIARSRENQQVFDLIDRAEQWIRTHQWKNPVLKWETEAWGEIPADFGRK